jgi:hypothetical protein
MLNEDGPTITDAMALAVGEGDGTYNAPSK